MFDLIKSNWAEISVALGAIASFFAGRKSKRNIEQAGELDNIERVREIEKSLLADMEAQIDKLIQTNNTLEAIIDKQIRKIRQYEKKYGFLNED